MSESSCWNEGFQPEMGHRKYLRVILYSVIPLHFDSDLQSYSIVNKLNRNVVHSSDTRAVFMGHPMAACCFSLVPPACVKSAAAVIGASIRINIPV